MWEKKLIIDSSNVYTSMSQSTSHWKTLSSSLKKVVKGVGKDPTEHQLETVKAHIGELHTLLARLELDCESSSDSDSHSDSDSSESDSDSESDDSNSESDDCDGDSCPPREKRKYKQGPRAKGYKLFIATGGTRDQWSAKSDKYKDRFYEKNKNNM